MRTKLSFLNLYLGLFITFSFFGLNSNAQSIDSINVINYNITLDVNNTVANRHSGYCIVKARVINPLNNWAKLSLLNHNVDSVWVNSVPMNFFYTSPTLLVELPLGIQDSDTLDIKVKYNGGQVVEAYGWGGIHYDNNIIYTLNVSLMDTPHSYGRSWFPCQDMFNDKASFNYNITIRNNRAVYCGGNLDSISIVNDSVSTYHYYLPQDIAPYLASMTIANYCLVGDTVIGKNKTYPVEVWCFPADSSAIRTKIQLIKDAFHGMETHFGAFAFNKVRFCTTPIGSMEHVDNIALARSAAIGAGDANNSNIIHELAHQWFGCYMGGETEGNMWIKEGWTSMTENLSFEAHDGREYAKKFFRNEQEWVMNTLPRNEGYRALYPVEGTKVYARTTYRKGAAVVHTLKGYLGDSLFYTATTDMLSEYGYKYINTMQMRDYLSTRTGINLNDFWSFHILDSGYNHYSITTKQFSNNKAIIGIRQRMVANSVGLLSSRVPITFMDANWNQCTKTISFNGYNTIDTISLPFTPVECYLDLEEQIADATLDNYQVVKQTGEKQFPNTYFYANVKTIEDSIFLRSTLHWVGEDTNLALPSGIKRISNKHYWTIEGIGLEKCELEGNFYFNTASGVGNFDNTLISKYGTLDSLMLMYRPNQSSPWIAVKTILPNNTQGYLTLNSLWKGDYIMAVGDKSIVGLKDEPLKSDIKFNIYPNPTKERINIDFDKLEDDYYLYIYGVNGQIAYKTLIKKNTSNLNINLNLIDGIYPTILISKDGKKRLDRKIVITK